MKILEWLIIVVVVAVILTPVLEKIWNYLQINPVFG